MTPNAAEQQLLIFIMLLTGVSALAWLVLSRLMRVAPSASLHFSAANFLLLLGLAMLYQRQPDSSILYWQGSDLLALLAFVAVKAGFLALFKRPDQLKWDLGLLLAWSIAALQVTDVNREHTLGLLFSAVAVIVLSNSTYILYNASARSFKKRYAAAVSAPLAGISLLFLTRMVISLFDNAPAGIIVHQGQANLYWAYLVFVLLVNITIFGSTLVRLVAKIRYLADRDQLTGLYNRMALDRKLLALQQLQLRHQQPFAVLLMDLDHFKQINDNYGHLVGDKVLQHAAKLITQHIRQEDIAGRFGGEEFLLMLPMTDQQRAEQVATKLIQVLRQNPITLAGTRIELTTSIGIAVAKPQQRVAGSEQLLQQADQALYQAKANGRDQLVSYAAIT
ncbi:GGDEF domain-containing protein [Rheinheimera fenheensis]|uniref:GGDEF domain-containing protein n=1 Tax=Rheinheimera fenheensis TaxID=3152295 RepID=UPI003260F44B